MRQYNRSCLSYTLGFPTLGGAAVLRLILPQGPIPVRFTGSILEMLEEVEQMIDGGEAAL